MSSFSPAAGPAASPRAARNHLPKDRPGCAALGLPGGHTWSNSADRPGRAPDSPARRVSATEEAALRVGKEVGGQSKRGERLNSFARSLLGKP